MADTSRFYFAYGSNMDERQMALRCPKAKLVGRAQLNGHSFLINQRGVASVVPVNKRVVHGLLWTITGGDEKSLDRYEGVANELYRKCILPVAQEGSDASMDALVYVASNSTPGVPRPGYLEKICQAAKEHGLPPTYVSELESWLRPA